MANSADPDQLASSTDLDLHFCKGRVYPGSAGQGLRGLDTFGRFSAILYKGNNFMTSYLPSCTLSPFWKEIYSKRKEFAPTGSKFFPVRVNPFSKER